MKRKKRCFVMLASLLLVGVPLPLLADTAIPEPVVDSFQLLFPSTEIPEFIEVRSELYQFVIEGESFYLSEDGALLFNGKLWDVASGEELGEAGLKRVRRQAIENLGEEKMVVYAPEDYRYTINVFTDIDCSYCRKFHAEMSQLMKLGIRVNYLLTPLRGEESTQKAISVWCAEDRNQAMDMAKQGEEMPKRSCADPIEESLEVARVVGIKGTPWLVFESGKTISGYLPPTILLEELMKDAAESVANF